MSNVLPFPEKQHNLECQGPLKADHLNGLIEKFGYAVIGVISDGTTPAFTYTIGLRKLGHPEIIMMGIRSDHATMMINMLVSSYKAKDKKIEACFKDEPISEFSSLPAYLIKASVPEARQYAIQAAHWAQMNSLDEEYLQWVWPDPKGNFPWDKEWDTSFNYAQPMLGSFPESRSV